MNRPLKKNLSVKTTLCLGAVLFGSVFMTCAQVPEPVESKSKTATIDDQGYNKKPLMDFRDKLAEWHKNPKNDLYTPFQYAFESTVGADGKLIVEKSPVFTGPAETQEILKTAAAALSDSGIFKALKDLESKKVKLTFAQDGSQFLFRLEAEQGTEREAKNTYHGISIAIEFGKIFIAREVDEETDPANKQKKQITLELLKMTQSKREGGNIIIDITVPNKFAEDMYQTYKKDIEKQK